MELQLHKYILILIKVKLKYPSIGVKNVCIASQEMVILDNQSQEAKRHASL